MTNYMRLFPGQEPEVGVWYEECDALGVRSGRLVQGVAGGTTAPVVTSANINVVMQAAGGAGWEKAQATTPNYVITRPSSGASLDLHIETGGTLAAMLVANWPVPAAGVDQLRIRNFSAVAQAFSATGYSGIVTADGNVATSGTYSIPVDMAVHITIDENGWIQVAPMGQEVSQAELNAVVASLTDGSVQTLFDSSRADAVHFLANAFDLNTLTGTGWYNVSGATNGPAGGGWYYIFNGDHRNGATGVPNLDYSFQLAKRLDGAGTNNLLMRVQVANAWTAWATLATTADITDGGSNAYFDRLRWDGATAISATDLNALAISGFYDGQTLTNAPNGAAGWFYVIHQRHSNLSDATWHHQTAYALGSGAGSTAGEVYVRNNSGGTWQAWTRLDNAAVAPLASPALTGTPTAPTAVAATNTTQIATTAFVQAATAALVDASPATLNTLNELAAALGDDPNYATTTATAIGLRAPIDAPTFTGVPAAPTPAVDTNTTQLATTAFVNAQLSGTLPVMNGTATVGSGNRSARGNHVHPTDTSRAPLASPTLTGTIIADGTVRLGNGQDILSPPLVGTDITNVFANAASTAATTIATTDTALRVLRAGTSGTKWGNVMDVNIGSHSTGVNAQTRVDFRLSNGGVGEADMTALSLLGNGTAEIAGVQIATVASPVFTGTPQVSGNPKLGSNSGHSQRSFSDVAGAAMLMVPATGTAATTIATTDVAARFVKPGTASVKANAVFDIVVGSHTAGLAGATQVDLRLANASTNLPDTTVMTLRGNGTVVVPGMLSSAFNGARVGLAAAQSIPTGALTTINWTTEAYDTNTYHDNASNNDRLIAVAAGYYRIGAKVDFSGNATGSRALAYRINAGAAVVMNEMMPGGTSPISLTFSTEVFLTAGQFIDFQVWQSTGIAFNLNASSFATMSYAGS